MPVPSPTPNPTLDRRRFVIGAVAVSTAIGCGVEAEGDPSLTAPAAPAPAPTAVIDLHAPHFAALRSEPVSIRSPDGRLLTGRVSDLQSLGTPYPDSPRSPFSVTFDLDGVDAQPGTQGLYEVYHPQLGRHELFLVPAGARSGSLHAIFT